MTRLAAVLLLLAAGAHAEEPVWRFTFANGDRVHGALAGVRDGRAHLVIPASPRAVLVPLAGIERAGPQADAAPPPPVAQVLRLRDGGALLGQCRGIDRGRIEFAVETIGVVVIPPGEVSELLPAADAVRAYYRSVSDAAGDREPALAPGRFEALWLELGRDDANRAFEAHRELVRAGPNAVPALAARLRVAPDSPEAIERLIAALDDDAPATRLDAYRRLASLGAAARASLAAALRQAASPESRQRIALLLAGLEPGGAGAEREPDRAVRHFVRAIRVLEEIGTPEACAVLLHLASGQLDAPTAREARLALERLRRRR